MAKKYSYRERLNYHRDIMQKGLEKGGKLSKKESYSAGFVHVNSDLHTRINIAKKCDNVAFDKGHDAGSKARDKAYNYRW